MCFIFWVSTVPNRSAINARLFFPAADDGMSPAVGGPGGTSAGEGKNREMPLARKKSWGSTSVPRKTSSLKYRKCSESPSMWCS